MINFTNSAAMMLGPLKGFQSALDPVGPQAVREAWLWWMIFWICLVVFVLVWLVLSRTIAKRRGGDQPAPPMLDTAEVDRKATKIVTAATVLTVITLFVILVESVIAAKNSTQALVSKNPVSIQVIGHQWWWEIRYQNSDASQTVVTANEIHVPTGVPIVMNGTSRDVIHSFWPPNISGKRDLIPGYNTAFWFQVDKPGVYRGQCAEFCGVQHAKMAFFVVAQTPQEFAQWTQTQLQSAPEPSDPTKKRGQEVFLKGPCVMCHTIRGTIAGSKVGPDLTHVGGRISIGAGTLPNSRGNLGAWIADSQHIKPGNRMPPNPLPADDFQALLTYLESLQ
jgi:cytochrome c oxidase subunit II